METDPQKPWEQTFFRQQLRTSVPSSQGRKKKTGERGTEKATNVGSANGGCAGTACQRETPVVVIPTELVWAIRERRDVTERAWEKEKACEKLKGLVRGGPGFQGEKVKPAMGGKRSTDETDTEDVLGEGR